MWTVGRWAVLLGALLGFAVGIGGYTFVYARGISYLVDDPQACGNCHVMAPQVSGWVASSHRAAAGCNDCHTPSGFAGKYAAKAANGFLHSLAFTTGRFRPLSRRGGTPMTRRSTAREDRR